MSQTRNLVGVRSLKGFAAAASPGRILDLHGLYLERPSDPGYRDRPMFGHPLLNRAIIVKAAAGSREGTSRGPQPLDVTKVIFPFDPEDLDLGGHGMIVGRKDLAETLAEHLAYGEAPAERDLAVLALLDRMPSLDPFLLREGLAQREIEVAPCYFRFQAPEQGDMREFVAAELGALVALCFGETGRRDNRARKMSDLLLSDQNSPELAPLRLALKMGQAEFADAVFAWKGFLYYRWKIRTLGPAIRTARRGISMIRLRGYDDHAAQLIRSAKQAIDKAVLALCGEVRDTLRLYDGAFRALTEDRNPERFRAFLNSGSTMFLDLGVRVGRLEQLVGFWAERFSPRQTGGLSADTLLDALRDVLLEVQTRPQEVIFAGRGAVAGEPRPLVLAL